MLPLNLVQHHRTTRMSICTTFRTNHFRHGVRVWYLGSLTLVYTELDVIVDPAQNIQNARLGYPAPVSPQVFQSAGRCPERTEDKTQSSHASIAAGVEVCQQKAGDHGTPSEGQGKKVSNSANQRRQETAAEKSLHSEVTEHTAPTDKSARAGESEHDDRFGSNSVPDRVGSSKEQALIGADRIYKPEPDIEAIRFYLESNRKQHKPGITHNQRNVIRVASKRYCLDDGTLMYIRPVLVAKLAKWKGATTAVWLG